jgi:histidinol dehydrogenase
MNREILSIVRAKEENPAALAAEIRGRVRAQPLIQENVMKIISRVRKSGDRALRELTRELDNAEIESFLVSQEEIVEALREAEPDLVTALKFSLNRIRKTQGRLLSRLSYSSVSEGLAIRIAPKPLESVGCYIPGGRAAYASTVLMTAGVAKLAGVKRVVICSPPGPDGRVSTAILAAAGLCGVDEVYRVGGAQAVSALAYGTESIQKVQKIVGPGGLYASVAKRLVSDDTSVDFFAGPTEIVVVGDRSTDVDAAAWDLVGQAEHGEETLCGFITWDRKVAEKVRSRVYEIAKKAERGEHVTRALEKGFVALCRNRVEAAGLVNAIAPEHLELLVDDPHGFAANIDNAGLILIGKFAPCAASDYCIGTDHVIPTEGYARLRTGLSSLDFIKLSWVVEGTRDGLREVLPTLKSLAMAEGLPNHFRSVESRFAKR